LQVALVSSFEFLRNPIYRIIDGVSISSDGLVYSVVVAHRGEIPGIEEIELDPASLTSVALLRCLLKEMHLYPRLCARSVAKTPAKGRAKLLIGDQAIRFRQKHEEKFEYWDLGEQWKKLFDLPFVYALWLVRPELGEAKVIGDQLRALRDRNIRRLEKLIAQEQDFDREFCHRYLLQHLRFSFEEREQKGLQTFGALCIKHGLIPKRKLALNLI
jgi:chorismate dehydratase